jgi:hypothetical protein
MAGGAETPNIAALPAIARLGTCESARGLDADRLVKLLIQFAMEESLSGLIRTTQGDGEQDDPDPPSISTNIVARLGSHIAHGSTNRSTRSGRCLK